jgi:hypothetical protein
MQDLQTEHDAAVTAWMEKYGWPVDDRHYDVSRLSQGCRTKKTYTSPMQAQVE